MKGSCSFGHGECTPSKPEGRVTPRGILLTLLAALSIFVLALGASRAFISHTEKIERHVVGWEALDIKSAARECTQARLGPVLEGVDVVAYFGLNPGEKAVHGSPSRASYLGDYAFWFSSEANKTLFEGDPLSYVPQWGGFCAWGIAEEEVWTPDNLGPEADPNSWIISERGELYVFRSDRPMNMFLKDMGTYIEDGNSVWRAWWELPPGPSMQPFNTACFCNPTIC